jgi:hypothetical protein
VRVVGLRELIGGVALVGLAVVLAVSFLDDTSEDRVGSASSEFDWISPTATVVGPTSPGETASLVTDAVTQASAASAEDPAFTSSATTPTTVAGPGTTAEKNDATDTTSTATSDAIEPLPDFDPGSIAVRVLNGGGDSGAAAFVTGVLRIEGFDPLEPGDAAESVAETTVLYRPGLQGAAEAVNTVIEASPDRVRPGPDDPNWGAGGDSADVLVIVGGA